MTNRASTLVTCLPLLVAILLPSAASHAAWPPPDSLVREPERLKLPETGTTQEALLDAHPGVREFLTKAPSWQATVDPLTGGVDRAFGAGLAAPGTSERGAALGRAFLAAHRGMLASGLDLSDLVANADASRPLPDPEAGMLQFDLTAHGIPVLGSGVTLAVRGGRVFFVATSALAPVATSPIPDLDAAEALASLSEYLGADATALAAVRSPSLAFYPVAETKGGADRLAHHLVWILEVRPAGARPWEGYFAYVDAHDGSILAFFPEARTAGSCDADPAQLRGTASGGVRANRADDPEQRIPLPFVRVLTNGVQVSADLNGRFPYTGPGGASTLSGDFFGAHCDNCTSPVSPAASVDESGLLDFGMGGGSGGPPVSGNGLSTPADRTTYFQVNEARRLLQKWNNAFFSEVDSFVNINSTCNAFSSGYMLGFFRAGGNCNNTGEIRDVVQHELGHTWDRTDGTGITSGGLSEWKGDVLALLMGGDPCVGESFRITGGPTSTCSGVRDIDEKALGRVDHAATISRTSNTCGGGSHCLGEISGQASWHLLNNLLTGTDYMTGAALPAGNGALSAEQARWILERLLIGGGSTMATWDPTVTGISEYDAIMVADDDDGNLANGTPHAAYINAAYAHHAIAEAPEIGDSAECAPLSDPIVTSTVDRDPATGLPLVRLTWTPVGGATTFDVYRNTRAGDAFLPIAQNVSAGPVVDAGVQIGATYRYFVAAVRKTGCATISPGTNVETVPIGLPEVAIGSTVVSEAAVGSDNDGRIEPGERVRLEATLIEKGGVSGTADVEASLVANDPTLAPVVFGGPDDVGSLAPGGSSVSTADFEVLVGPSVPCGARVRYTAPISSDDGCWLDAIEFELSKVVDGCAPVAAAFVEVVPGSVAVDASGGDGDGIVDNCEPATVSYQVRNSGGTASGAVTSTVTTSHARVTFVPRPGCAVASLDPGQTASCAFAFSLGGATVAGVPFTLTATSPANAAPSVLGVVVPAESNAPTFSTVSYPFENALHGWTLQNFGLAFQPFTGARSMHAGSTTVSNICARMTSPVLLLDPANPSALSFQISGDIEPLTDQWYDRANVHLVDVAASTHTLISPTGFPYNASGTPDGGLCHVAGQAGWGGPMAAWSLATFDLAPWQGKRVRIEVNYCTDEGDNREGIYVDDAQITNATATVAPVDGQSEFCFVPEVSSIAALVPLRVDSIPGSVVRWTWEDLGSSYQYSLYSGALASFYSHGAGSILCQGRGAGMTCDGTSCSLDQAAGSLPSGDLYFLVTAAGFGFEGTSGDSTLVERDPLQSTCAP